MSVVDPVLVAYLDSGDRDVGTVQIGDGAEDKGPETRRQCMARAVLVLRTDVMRLVIPFPAIGFAIVTVYQFVMEPSGRK